MVQSSSSSQWNAGSAPSLSAGQPAPKAEDVQRCVGIKPKLSAGQPAPDDLQTDIAVDKDAKIRHEEAGRSPDKAWSFFTHTIGRVVAGMHGTVEVKSMISDAPNDRVLNARLAYSILKGTGHLPETQRM